MFMMPFPLGLFLDLSGFARGPDGPGLRYCRRKPGGAEAGKINDRFCLHDSDGARRGHRPLHVASVQSKFMTPSGTGITIGIN
jgi:hypothetical protein